MYIANNDLNLSGGNGLDKKSEKEPTAVLEQIIQNKRTEKDPKVLNQKALEDVRSSDTVRDLFEKQNAGNVVNEAHYGDKGINETQLNNTEGNRNSETFSSELSLFTREVFPKMRERMKKNEEFYKMPENKDRVGEGDVVSAGAKSVKVVKASSAKKVRVVKAVTEMVKDNHIEMLDRLNTLVINSYKSEKYDECVDALKQLSKLASSLSEGLIEGFGLYHLKDSSFEKVRVVRSQYAQPEVAAPTLQPSELNMAQAPISEIQQPIQQQAPQVTEHGGGHQHVDHNKQDNSQAKHETQEKQEDPNAPKKHSLKYWNHVTQEWKTIAEHDDADELENMKEKAIEQYYQGSSFPGKSAPFEIFVNEHVKSR